jgi:hypothetical protein
MQDRRKQNRLRTLKTGAVFFGHTPVIESIIRNLSPKGACLEFERPMSFPDVFSLIIKPECVGLSVLNLGICGLGRDYLRHFIFKRPALTESSKT